MPFYKPTEEQKKQAEKAIDQANLEIGRFVTAWSRLDSNLRALELMRVGKRGFRPLQDPGSVDLIKTRRFPERVKLVIPKPMKGEPFGMRDWLLKTIKVRNLILHGVWIFHRPGDEKVSTPVIIHRDFVSVLAASRGFPDVTSTQVPNHKNSLDPRTIIPADMLEMLTQEVKQAEEFLRDVVDRIHKQAH